jgi:hypothetical protein
MPPSLPIQSPSGYAASRAMAFADVDGSALLVSAATPMPVVVAPATSTPLTGSTAANLLTGPFQPTLDRAIVIALSGTWTGTVRVLRSTDGGATKLPLTLGGTVWGQFSANCCEPVWEESEAAARLYLDIVLASGTLAYRFGQ